MKMFASQLFSKSLASRQAFATVAVALVMGILISVALITWDYFRTKSAINGIAEHLLRSSQSSATQASYTLDNILAEQVLDGLFEMDAIAQASITNEKNQVLAKRDRRDQQPHSILDSLLGSELHFSKPLIHHDRFLDQQLPVGEISITLNGSIAGVDFLDRAIAEVIFGLIRNTLLAMVILLISRQLVTKPLTKIVESLSTINHKEHAPHRIPIPHGHEHDEMGFVVNSLNKLLGKIEQQVIERERIVEAIPDVIFFKDGQGRWLITNEPAKRLFKLHGIDWEGKTDIELAAMRPAMQAMHDEVDRQDKQTWDNKELTIFNKRVFDDDGNSHDYEVRKIPSFAHSGERESIVIIGRDVTEEKKVEERLLLSSSVFSHASEGIVITTPDATILEVNEAFTTITGYSREEVLGNNPRILSSGRHGKEFYTNMWHHLINEGFYYGEIWNKRKNGEIYPEMQTISAVRDNKGKVLHYVALFSDISQRKQADDEIHNLAFFDTLTKLPNRRLLIDRLKSALLVSARSKQYGAVLFVDMDNFKNLNDTLGHEFGDLLLVEVSKRIQSCVREVDTVARLGGDDFVVLLTDVDLHPEHASQKVSLIAEKIRIALIAPYLLNGSEYLSSTSVGVSMYCGEDVTAEDLLKHTDMAMYRAKESGRNTVQFFDPAMRQAVVAHAALEADLRRAVPDQQLQLYYQIQVDSDRRPIGAEALVRWIHPTRGMVSPAQFIPLAEESSLILEVGGWVLDTACQQLAEWSKVEQTRHLTLAVNVSARQFKQLDFVEKVAAALEKNKVDASRLKLELTESVVLNDVSDVISKMHALKALRVKLSMDDFGTGYSSLSYLKQLPLDQIKIDQSFVRDMTSDQNDVVMVQTIIDMAKNFRLNVIAEGVETEAQHHLLKHLGCMAYQGYFFSRPVPIEQFEALVKKL
ncbi:MAG: EAL domain-containing protein [Gallionellaceae bacterium]